MNCKVSEKLKQELINTIKQFETEVREEDTAPLLIELIKEYKSRISIYLYDLYDLEEHYNEAINT